MERILIINCTYNIIRRENGEKCNTKRFSPDKLHSSVTWNMSQIFIQEYKKHHKNSIIEILDLNKLKMSNISMSNNNMNNFINKDDSDFYIEQLKNIDKVIITAPNINSMYPATLKNYIDHIVVPTKTFGFDKKGIHSGKLSHLIVQIIAAQGGIIMNNELPMYVTLLERVWKFMGAQLRNSIILSGTCIPKNSNLTSIEIAQNYREVLIKAAKAF